MLDDTYFMRQALIEAQRAYDKNEVSGGCSCSCQPPDYRPGTQPGGDPQRCYRTRRNAGDNRSRQRAWRKIPNRLHAFCHC